MKIVFLHDWEPALEQVIGWEDGLAAAIRELIKRGHEVKFLTNGKTEFTLPHPYFPITFLPSSQRLLEVAKEFKPDVVLQWGDTSRPNARLGRYLGVPNAICFAGGIPFGPTSNEFDHFFVESDDYYQQYLRSNFSTSRAFGTNTKLYDPEDPLLKDQCKRTDIIFPATYAAWKRHSLLEDLSFAYRVTCAGYMYSDHETECWQVLQRSGSLVLPHTPASGLRHLLAAAKCCVIPSADNGGSQRTVLEAMAMNIPVIVMDDSKKTSEYVLDAIDKGYKVGAVVPPEPLAIRRAVNEWMDAKVNSREYVLNHWSHIHYADQIEAGLNKLVRT